MLLNDIDFYIGEWNICCDCVDELGGGGESEKSNKLGESTVSGNI